MGPGDRITRGILIGGAVGAFYKLFWATGLSMFFTVGIGAIAGFLAGLTRNAIEKRRNK